MGILRRSLRTLTLLQKKTRIGLYLIAAPPFSLL
jgi:hypothetical protein